MRKRLCVFFAGVGLTSMLFLPPSSFAQDSAWNTVFALIENRFPKTPTIEMDVLEAWQKEKVILLVDVRDKEEYFVSHIFGAQNRTSVQDFHNTPKDTIIVLYCSVGYRSAEIAHALLRDGFTKVYNLKGSIFAWVNSEKPVYQGRKKTNVVHPYNQIWGRLLHKKYHPSESSKER